MATQRHAAPAPPPVPRLPRIEGLGWMMLYVAAALVFLRWFLPLRLPGALLALAAALGAALVIAAWRAPRLLARISARWSVQGSVHALEEATVGAVLSARAGAMGGTGPFTLEAWNPTTRRPDSVLRLRGLGTQEVRPSWTVRFPRRGTVRLPPLVARSDQPFGMLSAARAVSEETEVLVLPALGSCKKELQARLRAWLETHAAVTAELGDDELAQLRDYRAGDAPHSIHWRASARARRLLVAERHALGCRRLAVVLDTASPAGDGSRFERLVCAAATLVHELPRQGWNVTLHGTFAPRGLHGASERLLEALALVVVDQRPVAEFIPPGVPSLVLSLDQLPALDLEPRPLALSLAEAESLVHIPTRVR